MRGLIIRQPWIDLIIDGKKTWEMRSRPTKVRGTIALIQAKSSLIVGTARLIESNPALNRANYMVYRDKHAIPEPMLDEVLERGWVHPWVLDDVSPLATPLPMPPKSGPVTFVNLDPSVVAAIDCGSGPSSRKSLDEVPQMTEYREDFFRKDGIELSFEDDDLPVAPHGATHAIFVFRPEAAQAYGQPLAGGEFVVHAGSTAMRQGSPNKKRDREDRNRLIHEGVLVPESDSRLYRFAKDHTFSSSSKAAGVVKDGNASGPSLWVEVKTGQSLKNYLAAH